MRPTITNARAYHDRRCGKQFKRLLYGYASKSFTYRMNSGLNGMAGLKIFEKSVVQVLMSVPNYYIEAVRQFCRVFFPEVY